MIPGRRYTPADIWALAVRFRWLILLPWIAITAGVFAFAQTLPDQYRSVSLIQVVPQRVPQTLVRSTVTAGLDERLPVIMQQILSRTKLERIIQDFELYTAERNNGRLMEDIIADMRDDIRVDPVKGDAFQVAYVSRDPRMAMRVTERLAALFVEENIRDREVSAEGANQFLESQTDDARRRLLEHEKKLEEYKRQYRGELPSQLSTNLTTLASYQANIQSLRENLFRDRDQRATLERTIQELEADAAVAQQLPVAPDPTAPTAQPAAVRLQIARGQLAQLQTQFTDEHPEVQRGRRLIRELEAKAAEEALATPLSPGVVANPQEALRLRRIQEARLSIERIDKQIAAREEAITRLERGTSDIDRRVEATPTRESEMVALTRDYETLRTVYNELMRKSEDAKVAANLERRQIGEQFKVLDTARVPERPFSPNRTQFYLGGLFGGLAVGVGLVGLLEYRDSTLRTDHDVVTALALPVLATIPAIITREDRQFMRRRRLAVAALGITVVGLAGAGLVAWRMNLLQRLF